MTSGRWETIEYQGFSASLRMYERLKRMFHKVKITDGPNGNSLRQAFGAAHQTHMSNQPYFTFEMPRIVEASTDERRYPVKVTLLAYDDESGENFRMEGAILGIKHPRFGKNLGFTAYYLGGTRKGWATLNTFFSLHSVQLPSIRSK